MFPNYLISYKPGLLQKPSKAVEALQISCLLLPPENRKRLQLLVRMMARISLNQDLPPLSESVRTRTLVGIKCKVKDLDRLLDQHRLKILTGEYEQNTVCLFKELVCLSQFCRKLI